MAVFYLPQIVSNFGWDPRRNKITAGREIVLVGVHKSTQEERKQHFQISQSYCFYLTIYVLTEVCRIQKRKKQKGLTKLIRSFGNVTDQTQGVREATIVSWLT